MLIKNIKSFTAMKIIDAIINNPQESRERAKKILRKNVRKIFFEVFSFNGSASMYLLL